MGQIKNIKLHIVTDIKIIEKMKRRYCELNVMEAASVATNMENIKQLIKLGYHSIAINRKLPPPTNVNKHTSKPSSTQIHSFANNINELRTHLDQLKQATHDTKDDDDVDYVVPTDFEIFSRVTVELETPDQGRLLKSFPYKDMLEDVDIIAVAPTQEVVLKSICEGKVDCDIVSLPLEEELNFKLTREHIDVITGRNIAFEITYTHAIRSTSLRKCVLRQARGLVQRSKRARGVFMSCGGEGCLDFRSPLDVVNMSGLMGVPDHVCCDVVSKNCWSVVARAKIRKHTYLGAVAVEEISSTTTTTKDVEDTLDAAPLKKQRLDVVDT